MKKGAVIGIVCGVLALGLGAIGVSAAVIFSSPTVKVTQGVTNLFSDYAKYQDSLQVDGINSKITNDNYKAVFDLDIYELEGMEDYSLGLDATVLCDYDKQKMKEELGFSVSYYELLNIAMAVDKTDVYLDIPALYEGSITFDSQNIDEQFNNSIFKDYTETELEEELSMNFFDKVVTDADSLYKESKKEIMQLVKGADIEKTGTVLPIEIGGKTVNCDGYMLTIKKEDINALYNSALEAEENYSLTDEDIKVTVFMDKKNNIKQIQTEGIYFDEAEAEMSVAVKFIGEKYGFEQMKGKMDFSGDDMEAVFDMDYVTVRENNEIKQKMQIIAEADGMDVMGFEFTYVMNEKDKTYDLDMGLDVEDENITFEMAGAFESDKKNYSMSFDDCAVYYQDEKVAGFEGSYRVEKLEEEIVIAPTKTYPIFEFTEDEFATFVMECYENLENYSSTLGGLF